MERKKIVLCLLLGLFVLTLIYRISNPYKQPKINSLKFAPNRPANRKIASQKERKGLSDQTDLAYYMELFLSPSFSEAKVIKNPFFDDTVRRDIPQKVIVPGRQDQGPVPLRNPRESMREKVMRELSEFKVFGFYEAKGTIAIFIQRGKDVLIVRPGDLIYGKYMVKDIKKDSITLRAQEIGEDVHVALDDF